MNNTTNTFENTRNTSGENFALSSRERHGDDSFDPVISTKRCIEIHTPSKKPSAIENLFAKKVTFEVHNEEFLDAKR